MHDPITDSLEDLYDQVKIEPAPGVPYQAYGRASGRAGALMGIEIPGRTLGQLHPHALIAAVRTGIVRKLMPDHFITVWRRAETSDRCFELLIAGFEALDGPGFLRVCEAVNPAIYQDYQRDLLAQLHIFASLEAGQAFDPALLRF